MTQPRLQLKQSKGWFAAGQEMAMSLEILSAAAFQLYAYLCLYAERHTGRILCNPGDVGLILHCGSHKVNAAMSELCEQAVCTAEEVLGQWKVEICDRFWPYVKVDQREPEPGLASYVQRVRELMLYPACVQSSFSPADERLAENFYQRGITLTQIQRAIWLGCTRKYITLLNGQTPMLITSLYYFSAIVTEVIETAVSDGYWLHTCRTAEKLERRWLDGRSKTE